MLRILVLYASLRLPLNSVVRGFMRQLYIGIVFSLISTVGFSAESCPPDFAPFLTKFESSREFQLQNTHFPLAATYVDGSASPEPRTDLYLIESAADPKYSRAIFPSREKQAAIPFVKKVSSKQSLIRIVKFTKPDTDYSFAFTFEQTASCWQLVRFEDFSL
jgi:hypothetical protein